MVTKRKQHPPFEKSNLVSSVHNIFFQSWQNLKCYYFLSSIPDFKQDP